MPSPLSIFRRKTSKKIDTNSEAPDSCTSSLEQARALQIEGRLDDALVKFTAASDQLESTEGDVRLRMRVQEEIAFLHLRRDDLPAAEEAFAKHLKMRKKNMGQGNRVTLAASLNLARVYINQGRMNDARKLIRLALMAYNEKDGSDCRAKFEAISCLADVSTHLGHADEACTLYQEALLGLESTSGPDDRHTLDTKFSLAMAHALMGRYIKAVDLLKEVIRRVEANTSGGNKDNLRARAQLCRIYLQMNQIRNAEIELRRCFEESEKMGLRATNNKHVVEATQALIELYRSDGKDDEITPLQAWIKGEGTDMPLSKASVGNIVPLTETESKLEENSEGFTRRMKIFDNPKPVVALLDTACQKGNWVSLRLIQNLHLDDQISTAVSAPELKSGTGHDVEALGAIELSWVWHPNGTRRFDAQFFVFKDGDQFDVVIGLEYIVKENLLQANTSAFVPLTEAKMVKSDKAAIALQEEKQRQDKAALAAKRVAAQQAAQQSSNSQASNTQQSG